ncbi:expressed unknown protein [Seminavis robusta]|uniref:Transmembrane protein n=1 Tax=Seminavis robusta TaxID=568900 RepID=A0A9N8HPL7_9STRA|nr:expressed unknown protein [Seminavis robusta]|eukprot:Sro1082_g239170.1 n/a (239) ;mRNA; r:10757-11473
MDNPSLLEFLSTWLLKTRMTFYNDDQLVLPWWFGLCCWNFAFAGAFMLWIEPQWIQKPQKIAFWPSSLFSLHIKLPYRTVAYLLIFAQAPLSFLADYCYMTQDSYWHVIDRCFAMPLMGLELLKFTLMARESLRHLQFKSNPIAMPVPLLALYLFATLFAIFSYVQSTQAQARRDHQAFILWHNNWHLFPLIAMAILAFDFYVCQGWKRSTRKYMYAIEIKYLLPKDTTPKAKAKAKL